MLNKTSLQHIGGRPAYSGAGSGRLHRSGRGGQIDCCANHKPIRFRLDEPAKEALLTESGGFPFFMVAGVAIAGGVLIGGVLALLFRRKLPAVPADG